VIFECLNFLKLLCILGFLPVLVRMATSFSLPLSFSSQHSELFHKVLLDMFEGHDIDADTESKFMELMSKNLHEAGLSIVSSAPAPPVPVPKMATGSSFAEMNDIWTKASADPEVKKLWQGIAKRLVMKDGGTRQNNCKEAYALFKGVSPLTAGDDGKSPIPRPVKQAKSTKVTSKNRPLTDFERETLLDCYKHTNPSYVVPRTVAELTAFDFETLFDK